MIKLPKEIIDNLTAHYTGEIPITATIGAEISAAHYQPKIEELEKEVKRLGGVCKYWYNASTVFDQELERVTGLQALYEEYTEWSVGKFGLDNPKHGATKLRKEAEELEENPTDIVEQADCLMCLLYNFKCAHPEKPISELLEAARRKLAVNKTREWIEQPDGTWQHKK